MSSAVGPPAGLRPGEVADALGNLMVGAGRVTANPEPADNLPVAIERQSPAEEESVLW